MKVVCYEDDLEAGTVSLLNIGHEKILNQVSQIFSFQTVLSI